jgi:hypothetical protein
MLVSPGLEHVTVDKPFTLSVAPMMNWTDIMKNALW